MFTNVTVDITIDIITDIRLYFCVDIQNLSEPSCYHEFCRLLARLKSNFQLGELVRCESYRDVIKMIAEFTVTSLQVMNGDRWVVSASLLQ